MSAATPPSGASGRLDRRSRRGLMAGLSGVPVLALAVPAAWADEVSDIEDELDRVRSQLADTASTVAEVEVAMADQNSRLEAVTVDAMVAREDHVEAVIALEKREAESDVAQQTASKASIDADEAR